MSLHALTSSITEVEVVVSVSIVLTLTEDGSNEMESGSGEGDTGPDAETVIDDDTVDEEALEATVHEMEEPLLGRVGSVMEDVTTSVRGLLVEILLTVPCSPLSLGHAHTLTVAQSHVLSVTFLVMGQSTSYCTGKEIDGQWRSTSFN